MFPIPGTVSNSEFHNSKQGLNQEEHVSTVATRFGQDVAKQWWLETLFIGPVVTCVTKVSG